MNKHNFKCYLVATIISLLSLAGCSANNTKPNPSPEQTQLHSTQANHTSPEDTSWSSAPHRSSGGRPLWIWIAPEYREDMPEGTGEYLIETI